MKSKVIQLSTSPVGRGIPLIIALCEDGSIWTKIIVPDEIKKLSEGKWELLEKEVKEKKKTQ